MPHRSVISRTALLKEVNLITTEYLHGHVGGCTLLVKHTETWVEPHAIEQGVQRMNDINTEGDCPTMRNIWRPWETNPKQRGETSTRLSTADKTASPLGGALVGEGNT